MAPTETSVWGQKTWILQKYIDRRTRRTTSKLKDILIDKLRTKPIERISVSELCEAADINRSAFCKHYSDIYDLLDDIEAEFLRDIDLVTASVIKHPLPPKDVTALILDFIKKYRELLTILLFRRGGGAFFESLHSKVLYLFRKKVLQNYYVPEDLEDDVLTDTLLFISSGFYSIYLRRLESDCSENISDALRLAIDLSEACIQSIILRTREALQYIF